MNNKELNQFFTWSFSAHIVLLIAVCLYMFFDLDDDVDASPKSNMSVELVYSNPPPVVSAVAPIVTTNSNSKADVQVSDNVVPPKIPAVESKEVVKPIIPVKVNKVVSVTPKVKPEMVKISKVIPKPADIQKQNTLVNNILNDAKTEGDGDNGRSEYIATIIDIVRPEYIPEDIDQNTTLVVNVKLNANMSLKSVEVKKYSSNDMYNQAILQKLKSIQHFPNLPDGAKFKDYKVMIFTFSPKTGNS
jgi:outer membrane biosynthesis protein TonB